MTIGFNFSWSHERGYLQWGRYYLCAAGTIYLHKVKNGQR